MMLLQIYFKVSDGKGEAFEAMYEEVYVPAMRKQKGYLGSNLLRLFPSEVHSEIEAEDTEFNYQMELTFDTEENRRAWVASDEHQVAWPAAQELTESVAWRGYDIAGADKV